MSSTTTVRSTQMSTSKQPTTDKRTKRRRRRRKYKRKQKMANNSNILEITTAKGLLKNKTSFDFTENEIVQSLNKNPEQKIRQLRKKKKKIKSKFHSTNNSSLELLIHGGRNNSVLASINGK